MKVLVRYNDCPDPALHSTIGIVVGGLILNRNPTAHDIIKKFIKSYNNLIKGYGKELKIVNVHLAIKKEGITDSNNNNNNSDDDDYIALPSDLLLSQCMIETDTNNNKKKNDGPTKNILYVRHGKSHTQASFLLQMKDQIRSAIQEEIRSVSSPTPTSMSNNNTSTNNNNSTQMSTKSHQRQSIDNVTHKSGGTVSISTTKTEQRDDEQQNDEYDEEQQPEALITNMESLQTIDSTTFVDGLKLASPNEILRMVEDENEKLDAYGNTQNNNMATTTTTNEDSNSNSIIQQTKEQNKRNNESAEIPEIVSSDDGKTTWLQFKRVMHSFGVDSVVYKDLVDEIRKSKRKQQQQQQLLVSKYRSSDGKMIVSDFNHDNDESVVFDKSIKNHLGTVFTKNFVSLRKSNINTTEEDDILYHDIEFEQEVKNGTNTTGGGGGGKYGTIITSASMRSNSNNNGIKSSIFDVQYWWNSATTTGSRSPQQQQQPQSSSLSSYSNCGFCTFNE